MPFQSATRNKTIKEEGKINKIRRSEMESAVGSKVWQHCTIVALCSFAAFTNTRACLRTISKESVCK